MATPYESARRQTISAVVERYKEMLMWRTITPDPEDDEEFKNRMYEFFGFCAEKGIRPTKEGVAAACGITVHELKSWEDGSVEVSLERKEMLKKTESILLAMLTEWGLNNTVNVPMSIFLMKNNFGYSDEPERRANNDTNLLGSGKSNEEIQKELMANVIEVKEFKEVKKDAKQITSGSDKGGNAKRTRKTSKDIPTNK